MTLRACLCAALLATSLGCASSKPDSEPSCSNRIQQPLYHASPVESYLGLAESQQRAVVAIFDETDDSALCSGAFIAGDWVLTAAHCDELLKAVVLVPSGTRMPTVKLPVVRRELHPNADIALFQVDFSGASFGKEPPAPAAAPVDALDLDITPLGLPSRELSHLVPDVAVELAGYGLTEQGQAGAVRYLVEQVSAVTLSSTTVAGFGRSGACEGDSGGPLLMRESGLPIVAGVLWGGSTTCLYEDDYLRTDSSEIITWLDSVVADPAADAPPSDDCGSISSEGRCLYGSALWCEASRLAVEPCTAGRVCGWSSDDGGYRCVAPTAPCAGVDAIGECSAGQSVRCVLGQTQRTKCEACTACRLDGQSGVPNCANDDF